MKFYLTRNTAGRFGGGLNGNLKYLPDCIQAAVNTAGFSSSFSEFRLTLNHPPLYVLPGVLGIEKQFEQFYNILPYSRLDRRYKTISISLQSPEFSEHFDKEEQHKYEHRFSIADEYKDIPETDLALLLLDKFILAAQIIQAKIKKGDAFDAGKFEKIMLAIKERITPDFLQNLHAEKSVQSDDKIIEQALKNREERKGITHPGDTLLQDVRIYCHGLPDRALFPYDHHYMEIFRNMLRGKGFMCPTYNHLYIHVATTASEALRYVLAVENWYTNGIAVLDYESYCQQDEPRKELMVQEAIIAGLRDIVALDGLNATLLEEVVADVKNTWLDTELVFKVIESSKYVLTVTYQSGTLTEQRPVYFHLSDKQTNKHSKIHIGNADNIRIHLWLQKITMTRGKIKVTASKAVAANVWLQNMPRTMEFSIQNIMEAAE